MGTAGGGRSSGSPDACRAAKITDRLEHQNENSQRFLVRDGTAGYAACASPRGKKQCCMSEPASGVETRTIPQSDRATRDKDAKMRQGTQAPEPSSSAHTPMTGIGDSTVRPIARDIRDTEQFETANDEPENPRDWTSANRIRLKSRGRERRLQISNTWKTTSFGEWEQAALQTRESDQPEEATVKDDIVMDQGPRDAGVTKMRMDEMLMDQVLAVSSGTSRVCVNKEKHEPATIRGLPEEIVKNGQEN